MGKDKYEEKLERLEADKKKINEKIRQYKCGKKQEEKKKEDRWKFLVGAYCLKLLKEGKPIPEIQNEEELQKRMDEFLTRDRDRELFDLKPKPKSDSPDRKGSNSKKNKNQKQKPDEGKLEDF